MRCSWLLIPLAALCLAPASAATGSVAINGGTLPDSSLADFSFLVPAPAGKQGFVTTRPDGHFYFKDGKRIKFWGVNVSSQSIDQTDHVINEAVARFRRAGVNMVRLEAADHPGMLIAAGDTSSRKLNPHYLDRMHRWMAACKRNGIYSYLQLLDFREFRDGDGVPNAKALGPGAKPYTFFDARLIKLQQEFARALLLTKNPYTSLRPVDDPAIAVIELTNENGLFIKGGKWRTLAAPYDKELQDRWNVWLNDRYHESGVLENAWRSLDGKAGLNDSESLALGNIQLPDMSANSRADRAKADWSDPISAPLRQDDGARFAYDVQTDYFRQMKKYLLGLGVKVPITSTVSAWIAPDVKSVADTLDFTAENAYWDHPNFEPGKEWQAPFYYSNQDPLKTTETQNFPPYTAQMRWKGKPVIIREWSAVWPNQYRAGYMPLAAAYAAYQDLDGMLAFTYTFNRTKLDDFAWEHDPGRWGLFGLSALLFQRGDVQAGRKVVDLQWPDAALFTWQDYLNDYQRLAYLVRLENVGDGQESNSAALALDGATEDPAAALKAAALRLQGPDITATDDLSNIKVKQSNGDFSLDTTLGLLKVQTDRTFILAGDLADVPASTYAGLSTTTPYGVIWATSLDGRPLAASKHTVVKMVSLARNTGEKLLPSEGKFYPGEFALTSAGELPIITAGQVSDNPMRFQLPGEPDAKAIRVGISNGTWELERNGATAELACDTPGVTFTVPGAVTAISIGEDGRRSPIAMSGGTLTYPEGVKRVELKLAG